MRVLSLSAIAVMMVFALKAADLAGTWKRSMEPQAGTMDVAIRIRPEATLVGSIQLGEYDEVIENGKVDGDRFSFEMNISQGKAAYEGRVAGDEMKLNVTETQGNKYTLTCKR